MKGTPEGGAKSSGDGRGGCPAGPTRRLETRRLALPVAALLLPALGLLLVHDLAARPGATVCLLLLAFGGWAWGLGRLASGRVPAVGLLLVAALLRLVMLPLPPTLSDDLWRYLWDGRVAAHGFDPYSLPPAHPELEPLRDPLWERLDHREIPTLYPPLSIVAFRLVADLPAAPWLWKALVATADLAACWWLLQIARRRGAPWRAAAYAWNPLVALEGAGMGHLEPLGVVFAVAAVAALSGPTRWLPGALAAAAGALVKLGPLAALPMWARQSRRPWAFLALSCALVTAFLLPVAVSVGGLPPGLTRYALTWEFGGPLYEPLWRTLAALRAPQAAHGALDLLKGLTGHHELWNRFYPWIYPQALARWCLALVAAGIVWRSLAWRDPVAGTGALIGGLLLCSPTLYPWYLLWVLPWAALTVSLPWLWASAAIALSYLPQHGGPAAWPWIHLAVWGPFFGLWLLRHRWGWWATRHKLRVRPGARTPPP